MEARSKQNTRYCTFELQDRHSFNQLHPEKTELIEATHNRMRNSLAAYTAQDSVSKKDPFPGFHVRLRLDNRSVRGICIRSGTFIEHYINTIRRLHHNL